MVITYSRVDYPILNYIIMDECISIHSLRMLMQTYTKCFVAKDAVKWLMKNSGRASSVLEAEALGNLLIGEMLNILSKL